MTLRIWQNGAKENYCSFAYFNKVVDKETSIIQMGPYILIVENEYKPIFFFRCSSFPSHAIFIIKCSNGVFVFCSQQGNGLHDMVMKIFFLRYVCVKLNTVVKAKCKTILLPSL